MTVYYDTFTCPICSVLVAVDENGAVVRVEFLLQSTVEEVLAGFGPSTRPQLDTGRTARARAQLGEYFAGQRHDFDIALSVAGTAFQRQVWSALQRIPYGQTRTYGQIAACIGRPKACRATGQANGANMIPVFIPCHRVIGADGTLTGFAGGLEVKRFLLRLEGAGVG